MTNELKHASVGDELTQTEWEAIGTHVFNDQATGDILYASSSTQLSRRGIGSTNNLLTISGGIPVWTATPTVTSITAATATITTANITTANISSALAITITALTAGDSYSGIRASVTANNATNAYGVAGYVQSNLTGTTAGHVYGFGSWINTSGTPVLSAGNIIVPFEGGVYTGEAQANARIVFGGQFQAILGGTPNSIHAFRLNYNRGTSENITAVFAAANAGSIAYTVSAGTSGNKVGDIPIADVVGTGVVYVRCYDAAG